MVILISADLKGFSMADFKKKKSTFFKKPILSTGQKSLRMLWFMKQTKTTFLCHIEQTSFNS